MSEKNDNQRQNIITIDGPSGVGKSSVSRKIAAATGFTYLDTGAMYRGVGWYFLHHNVSFNDTWTMAIRLTELHLELLPAADELSDVGVLVNGENISAAIRTPEMAMVASRVSAIPVVREILTDIQRSYGKKGKIVAEGRDTGTVVFPQAAHKFFLDAAPAERAQRRCRQLQARGVAADFNQILSMTLERDKNDSERAVAPLLQATDAHPIDTTGITVDQVVEKILLIIAGEKQVR